MFTSGLPKVETLGANETPGSPAKTTPKSLRVNFSWIMAGNIVLAASQLGMIVSLARLADPMTVGRFALALAVTSPISIFMNLKLRSVQATDANSEFEFSEYLVLRALTSICVPILAVAAAITFFQQSHIVVLVGALSLAKAMDSLSDVLHGLFQRHEQMSLVSKSLMLRGVGSLIAFTATYYVYHSLIVSVTATAVVSGVVFLYFDLRNAKGMLLRNAGTERRWFRQPHHRRLVALAWVALPLGLSVALGSLSSTAPRYLIEHYLGSEALGLFAAIATVMTAGTILINALSQSATPRLATLFATHRLEAFDQLMLKLCGLGLGLGVIGILAAVTLGRHALDLIYGEAYGQHASVLTWMMVALCVNYSYVFLGTAVNAMRMFKVQLPIHLASLIITLGASYILIGNHGLIGVAWAMLIASCLEAVCYLAAVTIKRRQASVRNTKEMAVSV